MIDFDKPLIPNKDRIKLSKIKDLLDKGMNPYDKYSVITHNTNLSVKVDHKVVTSKDRLQKFNDTIGQSSWKFIDDDAPVNVMDDTKVSCMACSLQFDHVTATYGRIIVNTFNKVIESVRDDHGSLVEYRAIIRIPVYKTGWICNTCSDTLYADKYYDKDGNVKRGIEYLDAPILKVKEKFRKGKREVTHTVPYVRSESMVKPDRDVSKIVSQIVHETNDDVEEWITKPSKIDEPVDPVSYAYFRRGR